MPRKNTINRPIPIQRTTIHLLFETRSVKAPAEVILQLSPRPRVIIEFKLEPIDYEASNEMRSKQCMQIHLDGGPNIDVLVGDRWFVTSKKISNFLVPTEQPVTVINENTLMNRCKFALINFPSIWGKQDITKKLTDRTYDVTQHLILPAFPWSIEIAAVDSLMVIDHKMKLDGGSAITHFGSIEKSSGQDFCLDELEFLVEGLHLFLSFARGSYCGLAFLSARDSNDKRVWKQWGTRRVDPWHDELPTWVCGLQSEMLSPVFEGFWWRFTDRRWNKAISNVIHWYLRSNASDEPEVGIILTQSALERLCFEMIGSKSDSEKRGDWIAKALKKIGIDHHIPTKCESLMKLGKQFEWSHGPHAMVEIRNDLIHPNDQHPRVSKNAFSEAWDLGQRYIELMLLNLLGHKGQYFNRLMRGEGYGSAVEEVPWITAREALDESLP